MTDKPQIEEMKNILLNSKAVTFEENVQQLHNQFPKDKFWVSSIDGHLTINYQIFAEALYSAWYRKVDENAVVLTREEYEKYQNLKRDVEYSFEYNQGYTDGQIKGSKETAKKILKWLINTGVINTAPDTTKMYFKERFGVEVK